LESRAGIVAPFLVGTIALNHLLLLGICFIHGGHYDHSGGYSMLMVSVFSRMLPPCIALLLCPIILEAGFGGKLGMCVDWLTSHTSHKTQGIMVDFQASPLLQQYCYCCYSYVN
jgi:Ca2+/H+ antiporter